MKEMRGFLIKTFLWILAAVGAAEYLVQAMMDRFVLPVMSVLFPARQSVPSISGAQLAAGLVPALLSLLLWGLSQILPASVNALLARLLERLGAQSPFAEEIFQMDGGQRLFLVLFLVAAVLVFLLPIAAGAVVFARIVVREFAKLERVREEERREYERQKNLMLSDIAHDLRTPITTVAGYAEALMDGLAEPERVQEYLGAIRAKSMRMNELITLLFDYVKLDSEGFSLKREPLDLCELLRENAALAYPDAEEAGMELVAEIPEERIEVRADRLQLSRVVTNLLTNAIRHNPAGTNIGLLLIRGEDSLAVAVADTGTRIGEELAEHLFEPFSRGDASRSGGGSGLGLSIAKKALGMHGWELALVQQPELRRFPDLRSYTKAFLISMPL